MGMIRIKFFCLYILFFSPFFAANSFAQQHDVVFHHLTIDQGLSQNSVKSIFKDSKGFMWFGTKDGLNRFNAYEFSVYKHEPDNNNSLSSSVINDILEDKDGSLWLATSNGLNKWNRQKNSFNRYSPDSSVLNILDIFQDKEGILWLSTHSGLFRFNPLDNSFTACTLSHKDDKTLWTSIFNKVDQDKEGNIWIASGKGLKKYSFQNQTVEHFWVGVNKRGPAAAEKLKTLFVDSRDNLWLGSESKGLLLLDKKTNSFISFSTDSPTERPVEINTIFTIAEGNNGKIWVGTENGGIKILDPHKLIFEKHFYDVNNENGLNNNSIRCIYRDDVGNMWIGTWAGGVNYLPRFTKKFLHYKPLPWTTNSLNTKRVKSLLEDAEGNLWIGTDGGGINVLDRKTGVFNYFREAKDGKTGLSSDYVHCILAISKDTLAIGYHNNEFEFLDRKSGKVTPFRKLKKDRGLELNSVRCLFKDGEGNLWIGTAAKGLFLFKMKTGEIISWSKESDGKNGLSSNNIFSILEDKDQNIWIGTEDGLNLLDRNKNIVSTFYHKSNDPGSLAGNTVNALYLDSRNSLWVATNGGLSKWEPKSKTFISYTQKDGLPDNVVQGILEDSNGNFWLSSNKGLIYFNLNTGTFRRYTITDGLQSNEFVHGSFHKNASGELFFGGVNGFNIFHPDSIEHNTFVPPVVLTGFQIFNKKIEPGKHTSLATEISEARKINLSYRESVFSIDYAALNYTNPQENQYAYKMDGFDKEWIYSGNKRSATYTNLDPGRYIFRVKASNNDGVWNEKGASIFILISPPFWKTWWFTSSCILTVILFSFGLVKAKTNRISLKNQDLEVKIAERTVKIESQKKEIEAQRDNLNQLNQAITQQNQALEQKVEERTKELVEYNQQLEQFAFITAHNLRAPVARILGLGNVLKIAPIDPVEEKFIIEKLIGTTEELDRVVKDINLILEIRKNNTVHIDEVDIREELRFIRTSLENEIYETETEIIEELSAVSKIKTVKPYLNSILYNLISNAIKYRNPERSPLISIKTEVIGKYVCLSVRDNGLGIDLAYHKDNIFNLYKRFHTHVEGKGMGLYLVKTQANSLGGKVEVESSVNKGTTFKVYLKND